MYVCDVMSFVMSGKVEQQRQSSGGWGGDGEKKKKKVGEERKKFWPEYVLYLNTCTILYGPTELYFVELKKKNKKVFFFPRTAHELSAFSYPRTCMVTPLAMRGAPSTARGGMRNRSSG